MEIVENVCQIGIGVRIDIGVSLEFELDQHTGAANLACHLPVGVRRFPA